MLLEVVLELGDSQLQYFDDSAINAKDMTVRDDVRDRPMVPIVGAFIRDKAFKVSNSSHRAAAATPLTWR